jgi:peptide/nickel transport system permease protein
VSRPGALGRLLANRQAAVCLGVVACYLLVAAAGALHWLPDADAAVGSSQQPPDWHRMALWLGTDVLSRSVLWRILAGTQTAVTIGFLAALISIPLGTALGLAAGWFGGRVDAFIGWLFSVVTAVPGILLIAAIAYALGKGLMAICIALAATEWVGVMRLVRGEVLKQKAQDYVLAARLAGAGPAQIMFGEIAPNVVHISIVWSSLVLLGAVKSEVILTYLGIGIQEGTSWGLLIAGAAQDLTNGIWWPLAGTVAAMFGLIYSLSVLGDALRDALDPKVGEQG